MSVYKVPQDVEADDKLIGPFSFRQFVYLMIVGGLVMLGYALFQIFPGLALIPVPFIIFFGALALPLRKDQPMETYLAAILSFNLKPRKRLWEADGQDRILEIVPPEVTETALKGLPESEVDRRLAYLSAVVDSGGKIVKTSQIAQQPIRPALRSQAPTTSYPIPARPTPPNPIYAPQNQVARPNPVYPTPSPASSYSHPLNANEYSIPTTFRNPEENLPVDNDMLSEETEDSQRVEQKLHEEAMERREELAKNIQQATETLPPDKPEVENPPIEQPKPGIMELASNDNISIATMAKEADRLDRDSDKEIIVSLR